MPRMRILLDIDGVLVTIPSWRTVELHTDGFMKFNERAAKNLARIVDQTKASIVLTTTHRINYSIDEWQTLLQTRGIYSAEILKINDAKDLSSMLSRAIEIQEWINKQNGSTDFVIIDDDLSINDLPASVKERLVLTKPMIGLDDEATNKVLEILLR
jgi:hypothetical protein